MTDNPEIEEVESGAEFTLPADSRSEVYEYDHGTVIFPHGCDVFAEEVHALAIRIPDKTGEIEILSTDGGTWRSAATNRTAAVASITHSRKPA